MNKKEIRQEIKRLKGCLTDEEKTQSAFNVFSQIEASTLFSDAENILLYISLLDELSTKATIPKWDKIKTIFLPRVNGNELEILPYDASMLERGSFNIDEPVGENIYIQMLYSAKDYVWITTPYLIIDEQMKQAVEELGGAL